MTDLPLFDAHCHPTHPGGSPLFANSRIFAQSVDPDEWHEHRGDGSDPTVVWGIGLHPLWLKSEDQVQSFFASLGESEAVGEVGLDYTGHAPLEAAEQRKVLERVLADPLTHERLVSLHALLAYDDVIAMVIEHGVPGAIIHWYSDAKSMARAVDGDLFFSVNDAVFTDPAQIDVVRQLPVNRILTETDAPYIARGGAVAYGSWLPFVDPTKDYGVTDDQRLKSGEVTDTERSLADLWKVELEEVRLQVWRNLAELEGRVVKRPFGAADVVAAAS